MRWDATGYGAHTDKATGGAAYNWYFAEGSQGFFWTYLLLTNPDASANEATVTFLRENLPPLERTYPLGPMSRATIDLGQDAELMNTSFGIEVKFDSARHGGARDVLRRIAAVEGRTRIGRRNRHVVQLVPGRRRDGHVLRDVHPDRQHAQRSRSRPR